MNLLSFQTLDWTDHSNCKS